MGHAPRNDDCRGIKEMERVERITQRIATRRHTLLDRERHTLEERADPIV